MFFVTNYLTFKLSVFEFLFSGCFFFFVLMNAALPVSSRSWVHQGVRKPMISCFCDFDVCNVSIDRLNQTTGGGTMPTGKPTTPIGKAAFTREQTSLQTKLQTN